MPYVLSRLIYNVSGKGEMRVGVRARRHELGAHPLLPLTDGETEARGEGAVEPRDAECWTSDAQCCPINERKLSFSPSCPMPEVVLMDYCFSF